MYTPLNNITNPETDVNIERVIDSESPLAEQNPSGQGISNALSITFGAAESNDFVSLSAAGELTIVTSGTYRIKISYEFGRSGSAGTAHLYAFAEVNGVQAGRSVFDRVVNANDVRSFENDSWLYLPSGTVIKYKMIRDEAGSDSGGLIRSEPTNPLINAAPCASLRVEKWARYP